MYLITVKHEGKTTLEINRATFSKAQIEFNNQCNRRNILPDPISKTTILAWEENKTGDRVEFEKINTCIKATHPGQIH